MDSAGGELKEETAAPTPAVVKIKATIKVTRAPAKNEATASKEVKMTAGKPKDPAGTATTASSSTEKESGDHLDLQLLNLLNTARIGDARTLQKMTTSVRKFLDESNQKKEEDKRRTVSLLLGHEGFVPPLLMKCLKSNVGKIPALVSDSLWILNSILDAGNTGDHITRKIDAVAEAGAIPLLVKLANVQEHNMNLQAIGVLEQFAWRGYRDQFLASRSALIPTLIKLTKKKNIGPRLQLKLVNIVSTLLGQGRDSDEAAPFDNSLEGYQEMMKKLPPVAVVKDVIPLLLALIDTIKDEGVLGKALSCLAYGGCVKDTFQLIVDSGILKKVSLLFSHPDEMVSFFAITAVSSIASLSDDKALVFLKSMKGTFGLKDFYLGLQSTNCALAWAADQFFGTAVNGIAATGDLSALSAVLTSGFIHALVHCLDPERGMIEKHVMGSIWTIGRISTDVPLAQRRVIVEAGALPYLVEQLKSTNETICSMAAVSIGNLVQERPLNRDTVVERGAVPLMIDLVQREGTSLQGLISVLASLEIITDVRPPAHYEVLKDLPTVLMGVMDGKGVKFPDKLIPGIYSIIWKLCDSGHEGIDLVINSGFLPRLETGLSCGSIDTQAFAVEAIEAISRGTKTQREALMDVGIVEVLVGLLQHSAKYICRVAMLALANLYKGQLTPERRQCIQNMVPQVLVEMSNQDPRTNHPAGLAFQNVYRNFKI